MDSIDNWRQYWDNYLQNKYGKNEVATDDDLFFQVARTVQKKPIGKEVFEAIVGNIIDDLELSANDVLVDFCCGNGLFTFELKDHVSRIIGIDFSKNIIDTARKLKSDPKITYLTGSATDFLENFSSNVPGVVPNKYLMNDSLAYFKPADLKQMLEQIKTISPVFTFVLRGVPNDTLKWNFYNTEERKQVYYSNLAKGDEKNDGLGNWWKPEDIESICRDLGLKCTIRNQVPPVSDYRMDIIIGNI